MAFWRLVSPVLFDLYHNAFSTPFLGGNQTALQLPSTTEPRRQFSRDQCRQFSTQHHCQLSSKQRCQLASKQNVPSDAQCCQLSRFASEQSTGNVAIDGRKRGKVRCGLNQWEGRGEGKGEREGREEQVPVYSVYGK